MSLTEAQKATNYDTFRHIERVRNLLNACVVELLRRGELHDQPNEQIRIHPNIKRCHEVCSKYDRLKASFSQFMAAMVDT